MGDGFEVISKDWRSGKDGDCDDKEKENGEGGEDLHFFFKFLVRYFFDSKSLFLFEEFLKIRKLDYSLLMF